jgi:predicted ester cyclase
METLKQIELNKKICRYFFYELHNRRNLKVIDDLVDDNVISHDPFPGQMPGAYGLKNTMQMFREAFPDLYIEIKDMLAENDRVMTRLCVSGTHSGTFMDIAPTHNTISYDEIIVLRLTNGKIVEHWAIADALTLMLGIGAVAH